MPKKNPAKLKKVTIKIPWVGELEFEDDPTQRMAAWSLYVELVTRIAVEPLGADEGILREALNSLYSLFSTTREILKTAGPEVGCRENTVGGIAIIILNKGIRPFLAYWHPRLQAWEAKRDSSTSMQEHEQQWTEEIHLRKAFDDLRIKLTQYADALEKISGV